MAYNRERDFVSLLRLDGTDYKLTRMPGLDFVVLAVAQAGMMTVQVGNSAPTANQNITAWLDTSVPSYAAEGTVKMWDGTAYVVATMALFGDMLGAASGLSKFVLHSGTGIPQNDLGNNADFYIRTDEPGGIYGPRSSGSWPVTPVAGSANPLLVGTGIPSSGLGKSLDWYARTDGPGGIYQKIGSVWTLILGTDVKVINGAGIPAGSLGEIGQLYFRSDEPGGIYLKTGATTWTLLPGTGNNIFYSGAGAPVGSLGNIGDIYFRTDTPGGTYLKTGTTTWLLLPGSTTTSSASIITGSGVPAVGVGVDGDWFGRTDAPGGIYYKAAGVWTLFPGTGGLGGAAMLTGTGVPAAGLGDNGDIFHRTDTPYGTYFKTAGAWVYISPTGAGGGLTLIGTFTQSSTASVIFAVADIGLTFSADEERWFKIVITHAINGNVIWAVGVNSVVELGRNSGASWDGTSTAQMLESTQNFPSNTGKQGYFVADMSISYSGGSKTIQASQGLTAMNAQAGNWAPGDTPSIRVRGISGGQWDRMRISIYEYIP